MYNMTPIGSPVLPQRGGSGYVPRCTSTCRYICTCIYTYLYHVETSEAKVSTFTDFLLLFGFFSPCLQSNSQNIRISKLLYLSFYKWAKTLRNGTQLSLLLFFFLFFLLSSFTSWRSKTLKPFSAVLAHMNDTKNRKAEAKSYFGYAL